jgi:Ca2+-transporting ATPase
MRWTQAEEDDRGREPEAAGSAATAPSPAAGRVQAVHTAVAGRVRLRVAGLYRSQSLRRDLESFVPRIAGVSSFEASALTGRVLVLFRDPASLDGLVDAIEQFLAGRTPGAAEAPAGDGPRRLRPALPSQGAGRQEQRCWHRLEAAEVLKAVEGSARRGLSGETAARRLAQFGPNVLPESPPRSALGMFLDQFRSVPVALLGASAVISVATGGVVDAVVIMGVVVINAAIGFVTERQAERTIDALANAVRPAAQVIRDGREITVGSDQIVVGDLLALSPGSYVAADARVVQARRLTVDESPLTGESMPATKSAAALAVEDLPLGDRVNMVYMGTTVTGGSGLAVVVGTARFTELGTVQALVGEARPPETPMERQLEVMGERVVVLSGAICGLVFVLGLLRGYGLLQMLKTAISLAVAAVPEGLPTVATTTLAIGIRDMRRHKVLIRHLEAVETLGAVQVFCLDKTGTLTMNRMAVVSVCTDGERLALARHQFLSGEGPVDPDRRPDLRRLAEVSALCSEAELDGHGAEASFRGSPTEVALLRLARDAGVEIRELRGRYPLTKLEHRAENRNYMATYHSLPGGEMLVAVKGSPSEVLDLCAWSARDGEREAMTEDRRAAIQVENDRMAGEALRVLGLAYAVLPQGRAREDGLTWVGLVGMADPVRAGVKDLIGVFHEAGIDTVMITGDQSPTAYTIGKSLNLSAGRQLEILDSTHLERMDPEVLAAMAQRVQVFARVSPAHKLQIVQALQRAGEVVAMTGDGINDGPALRAADIGIAMGAAGTDVARTVADVVLEDDDLATMVAAVSRGRTIYGNIRKSIHFLLATNLSEIMVMLGATAAGAGQPLTPMQLLWINLVTDIFPGLALAMEAPEPDVLQRPPRDPGEPIVAWKDFKRIGFESSVLTAGALGAYGYGAYRYGMGPQANTLAFMGLTLGQLLHALSCRSETRSLGSRRRLPPNPYLSVALAGSLGLQLLSALLPGLRTLLGTTPMGLLDAAVVGGAALGPLLINELSKQPSPTPRTTGMTSPARSEGP